ncbi:hypothetical protein [Xanthomonas sp. MUS 060]|uniref:hypothetical protein n=1 Tax=Xanthomonas sp. MUS 060 TaxID=1588031 RepID=UPI000696B086|nr:hypothetical protein [Xanthomonas sp. MUS 060]
MDSSNLSYKNDPALKALHVAQAEQHAAQDMLVAGTFGEACNGRFRGCSVGCFAHEIDPNSSSYHATVAEARGLPEWLIQLQDSVFEGLPESERPSFHVELAKRIPVGADLSRLPHLIAIARIDRLLKLQRAALARSQPDQVHAAIEQVLAALETGRRFHEGAAGESAAEWSAWSAEWSAARSARSAARSAEWSAARSARSAAESAAESAWSAAWSAARSARSAEWSAWIEERDALFASLAKLEG